ncbi:MAG: hypothetical protein NUV74_03065 [Candidatus Brocadiaceae bacterium]|nr:hypothetical protein [Candidatus Brocadiaceae bacterium]
MFDEKKFKKNVEKIKTKSLEKINQIIVDEISTIKCEEHGKTPQMINSNLDENSFSCCCDSMKKIVLNKLKKRFN